MPPAALHHSCRARWRPRWHRARGLQLAVGSRAWLRRWQATPCSRRCVAMRVGRGIQGSPGALASITPPCARPAAQAPRWLPPPPPKPTDQMLNNPEVMRSMIQAHPGLRQVRGAARAAGACAWSCQLVCSSGVTACAVGPCHMPARVPHVISARTVFRPSQLMDTHPELAHMLNNPELLRESLRVMANPVRCAACHCFPCGRRTPSRWRTRGSVARSHSGLRVCGVTHMARMQCPPPPLTHTRAPVPLSPLTELDARAGAQHGSRNQQL